MSHDSLDHVEQCATSSEIETMRNLSKKAEIKSNLDLMPCLTLHTIIIKSFLSLFSSSTMKLQQNFFLIFQSGPRECECMKFHFFTASLLTLHGYITSTISRIYTKALQSQINLFQCEQEDSLGSE